MNDETKRTGIWPSSIDATRFGIDLLILPAPAIRQLQLSGKQEITRIPASLRLALFYLSRPQAGRGIITKNKAV